MALSPEDRTEIQLLVMQEVGKIFDESGGFSEARRAVNNRTQELEAELLDHQRSQGQTLELWKTDLES